MAYLETQLDLTECETIGTLHRQIKQTFRFPDYYGENWDAFIDSFYTVGIPDKLIVRRKRTASSDLEIEFRKMRGALEIIRKKLALQGQRFLYEIHEVD